jgi:hypothetical protein
VNNSTFDPFTLESTFDPLGSEPLEPTGQSAYSRRESLEPTGQSAYSRQDPPPPPRRRQFPTPGEPAASPPPDIGAGNRLAHLLRPSDQPAANRQPDPGYAKATTEPEATTAHLQALEDDLAILTARLDSLHTAVNERLGDQREKLVKAVAALLDERLGPRR